MVVLGDPHATSWSRPHGQARGTAIIGGRVRCELDSSCALGERPAVGFDLWDEAAHRWISSDRPGSLIDGRCLAVGWAIRGGGKRVCDISALRAAFRVHAAPSSRDGLSWQHAAPSKLWVLCRQVNRLRGLPLHRPRRQPRDELPRQQQIRDHHRQRRDRHAGEDETPFGREAAAEGHDGHRQGHGVGVGQQDEAEEEIVPHPDAVEDDHGGDGRARQRQHDPPEDFQMARAVDARRFLQIARQRGKKAGQHQHPKGDAEDGVDEDQREQTAQDARLPEHDEERQDDQLHRHDQPADEEKPRRQPPREAESRQPVGRQAGQRGADQHPQAGGDDAVAQRGWQVRLGEGLLVVVQPERLGQAVGRGEELVNRLERPQHDHHDRDQHEGAGQEHDGVPGGGAEEAAAAVESRESESKTGGGDGDGQSFVPCGWRWSAKRRCAMRVRSDRRPFDFRLSTRRSMNGLLALPQQPHQQRGHAGQEEEEGDAFRHGVAHARLGAEAAGAEGVAVDQNPDDQGRAVGRAEGAGQDINQVEGAEDEDEREDRHHGEGGGQHGEGDVAKDLPALRPVD